MADLHNLSSPALNDAIQSEGGGIPTGIVTIAEVMLDDGQHYLMTLADGDLSTWRKMGMLHGAMADERMRHSADVLASRIEGDDL